MWKSICSLLMIATACVPAEAARFSCVFEGNKNACMVDTQDPNGKPCKQAYPAQNVTAVCEGGPMGGGSEIDCYFSTGSQNPRKLSENELSASSNLAKAMAEQSGYRTVGIEYITNTGVTILRVGFSSDTGFAADAVCSPK